MLTRKSLPTPVHRLESFSDGVIAIVITLMILEIKIPPVPDQATAADIWKSWFHLLPSLVAYVLFWMCIVPIPTEFLGLHFQRPEATALYGFTLFMNAMAFALMREYVNRNQQLLIDNLSPAIRVRMRKKLWTTVTLYFISIFAGFLSIYISIFIFVLILIIYFMPQKIVVETTE